MIITSICSHLKAGLRVGQASVDPETKFYVPTAISGASPIPATCGPLVLIGEEVSRPPLIIMIMTCTTQVNVNMART